jgi:hypothetical protein
MAIVASGGLEVCDGAHWLIVMKKGRRAGLGGNEARAGLAVLSGSERYRLVT